MNEVEVIFPVGFFGESDSDTALDWVLREIGKAFCGPNDWGSKYGAEVDNDTFLMKPYCWCEKEGECPWCTGCAVYQDNGKCVACADPSLTIEQRRASPLELQCDYAAGLGIFARFHPWTLDHKSGYYDPPNFWYKPTNLRVTWYKYIGRGTKVNRAVDPKELQVVLNACLGTLERGK